MSGEALAGFTNWLELHVQTLNASSNPIIVFYVQPINCFIFTVCLSAEAFRMLKAVQGSCHYSCCCTALQHLA